MTRFPRTAFSALLLAIAATAQAVTIVPLNDTGQSLCYDSAGTVISCASSGLDDGHYGRDAANTAGQLGKTGAGSAGFDFSKIANNGTLRGANAVLGTGNTDWACTRDNVTGLVWEVKTTSGLRSSAHGYSWYSTDSASNGGYAGYLGGNSCGGTLSAYANQCNTANYVAAVNAAGLCGATDWRMPNLNELHSILDYSRYNPAIDPTFFPNTIVEYFWSASAYASLSGSAWYVHFYSGGASSYIKNGTYLKVRLVRAGQ